MKPAKKVLNGLPAVKVAIVQTAPVFLDRERTIDKACLKIAEAAAGGAQIVVFSEAWISGYPYWGEGWQSRVGDWMEVRTQFFDSALVIGGQFEQVQGAHMHRHFGLFQVEEAGVQA